mgnify:CR=1 FL=1
MIHLLKLFNNPLTKMVVNKATDHFKHKAEKVKVIREWVSIINDLPDSVWYLVIIVFTASFGSKVSDKLMNRKKK